MGFKQAARGGVTSPLESLDMDVEVLSYLILLLRIGSDLDRSSPKQETRCLEGYSAEEVLRLLFWGFEANPRVCLRNLEKIKYCVIQQLL